MPRTLNNVVRQTLTEMAYDEIIDALETGLLKAGEKINESVLARQLGISRFPVREALRSLQKIGLVLFEPFKGVRVIPATRAHIRDILQVHFSLEELSIRLMMEKLTAERVAELERRIEVMRQSADMADLVRADLDFHRAVCVYSENTPLINSWQPLTSHILVCMHAGLPLYENRSEHIQTHADILAAIKTGDVTQALNVLRRHCRARIKKLAATEAAGAGRPKAAAGGLSAG
ncbi:GntR family transcriptional regulator [Deltaproteobacteria bacterium OttesenSCG-928-M10]|nr:GntR family transcriptional regulator [Deltaproteobacteria bacterium OttesenSCG-928-M10]